VLLGLIRRRFAPTMLVLLLLASSCMAAETVNSVILLIGDGMGVGPISSARCEGPGRSGKLAVDTMPFTGFALTYSADALVTDSAAAGTALATGVKTNNGTISMTPDGKSVTSILEVARDMGKSTGIISTKSITDATPAVFVAHADSRAKNDEIALQMIASGVNVILGGGERAFKPKSAGGSRTDEKNLMDEAKSGGYDVFGTVEDMNKSKSAKILGLFASDSMASQRPEPTLAEMTSKAVSVLSANGKGFFLMSEGGKIDSEAHLNNAAGVVREMLMFDDAIRAALDFAKKDTHTLVIVTADHDTGGMAVKDPDANSPKFTAGWVTMGHTGNMVPIYAFGPGAERFTGTHDNIEIPKTIAELWGQKLN
jgi:alkaline phosphatase